MFCGGEGFPKILLENNLTNNVMQIRENWELGLCTTLQKWVDLEAKLGFATCTANATAEQSMFDCGEFSRLMYSSQPVKDTWKFTYSAPTLLELFEVSKNSEALWIADVMSVAFLSLQSQLWEIVTQNSVPKPSSKKNKSRF